MPSLATLPTIDADRAAALAAASPGVVLLDVREHAEWSAGHAPLARHIPLRELPSRLSELPRQAQVVCICRSGNRSGQATGWLLQQGIDAVNLSGGMQRWAAHGHAVVDRNGHAGRVA